MEEKELIRKALLGDKKAQDECTDKGIMLPCPCCGQEPYTETFFDRKGWYAVVGCADCPIAIVTITCDSEEKAQQKALKDWNTRPAPPIGRCGECRHCVGVGKNQALRCTLNSFGVEFGLDFITSKSFCSYFEPREE